MITVALVSFNIICIVAFVIGFFCGVQFTANVLQGGNKRDRKHEKRERERKQSKLERWDDNE
ncbi:hypothetical protein IAQ67_28830 (plasmid) [Paenibacillus peoriae]|uniref:Uncharacterized protein n=1 Tax=Paenibacillus peoriae TaxID=59893 RepID=A0A7H0YH05_9BACL|nr:hypothetical protein [Paenibacillus peoriae]QNR70363.1 hypothetical protein IAQ67_28830 [Paenibacillus peoriae]